MKKLFIVILLFLCSLFTVHLNNNKVSAGFYPSAEASGTEYVDLDFAQVSLAYAHSSAITPEGRILTWGNNTVGQLGIELTTSITMTVPNEITDRFNLSTGETITHVSSCFWHALALTSEGRVFAWGDNQYGELGNGTVSDLPNPTPIDITSQFNLNGDETIVQIADGFNTSSALTSDGRIFTWGRNDYGQLGDGTTTNRNTPTDITNQFTLNSGEVVTNLAMGAAHSSAITSDGRVFAWGSNGYGQLGDGTTTTHQATPTDITSQFSLNATEEITALSLGMGHSSALTSEGRFFMWGNNNEGQLGNGTTTDENTPTDITSQFGLTAGESITSVSLGAYHSSVITSEGRVFTWGSNSDEQLGDGGANWTGVSTPAEITSMFTLNTSETIIDVSLGFFHSAAITSEGRLFTWGGNESSQLGDGGTEDIDTPTLITVTAEDTTGPMFDSISDQVIEVGTTDIDWTTYITNLSDNGTGDITLTEVEDLVDYDTPGTYSVTVKATDSSGNETTQTFSVTVVDTTGPTFDTIADQTIEVGMTDIDWTAYITNVSDYGTFTTSEVEDLVDYDTPGTYTVTVKVTDSNGNETTQTFNVTVVDTAGPTFDTIADQTIEVGTTDIDWTTYITNISDVGSQDVTVTEVEDLVDYDTPGTYTVTVKATDSSGNETTQTFNVTVEGVIGPTFDTIADQTIEAGTTNIDWTTYITNVSESDGTFTTSEVEDLVDYNTPGTYTVTVRVTDSNSNETTQTFNVTVVDTTGPTFDTITDQTVEAGVTDIDWTSYVTNLSDDGSQDVTVTVIEDLVDYDTPGTYTVTVKATDSSGNETTQTFNVTIDDTTSPTFDTIVDQTVEAGTNDIDWSTYVTNLSDNGSQDVTVSVNEDSVDYDTPGTYTVTVKATDSSGNETTQSFNVTINDTTPPTFDTISNQTIEAGVDDIDWTTYITNPQDNSGGALTKTVTEDLVDYDTPGTYTVTVKLNDDSENETKQTFDVTVEDTTGPTFTIDDQTIDVGSDDIDWTSYMTNVSDNASGELTLSEVEDLVDYSSLGTYQVTVKAVDSSGNETSQTIDVTVQDTTAPTFDIIEDQTIEAGADDIDWSTYITNAQDNSDGALTKIETEDTVDYDMPGTYTVTVKLKDESENETTQTFDVTVEDTTGPTFTIEDQIIERNTRDIDWTSYMNDVSDNSNQDVRLTEVEDTIDYRTIGTYTVTVKATDSSGNETTKTFNVTVEDTTPPGAYLNPGVDSIRIGETYRDAGVEIVEDDYNDTTVETSGTVDTMTTGTYVITYTITDTAGNETILKRYVTVYEGDPIVEFILGDANTTIEVGNEYVDGMCTVVVNGNEHDCDVKENTVDESTAGVYHITYAYTHDEKEYTYKRYVFVTDGETELNLYLPGKEEDGVEA